MPFPPPPPPPSFQHLTTTTFSLQPLGPRRRVLYLLFSSFSSLCFVWDEKACKRERREVENKRNILKIMAVSRISFGVFATVAVFLYAMINVPLAHGQSPAPAPSTAASDGTTIDQGIAYVLMLVALVLTYIIH